MALTRWPWFLRSVITAVSPALGVWTLLTGSLSSSLLLLEEEAAGSISPLQLLLAPILSLASRR